MEIHYVLCEREKEFWYIIQINFMILKPEYY
jgi:hypothetical protein